MQKAVIGFMVAAVAIVGGHFLYQTVFAPAETDPGKTMPENNRGNDDGGLTIRVTKTVRVVWEAEDYIELDNHSKETGIPIRTLDLADASGGKVLDIPELIGKPGEVRDGKTLPEDYGVAVYAIDIPEDGYYRLWARVLWGPDTSCSDSFRFTVDASGESFIVTDGTYHVWHWVHYRQPIRLKKGKQTVRLINNEDGIQVDQFMLIDAEANYRPTGIESVSGE